MDNHVALTTATIGNEVLPVQQPILLQGGSLPPLNVFHNPVWMNSARTEETFNANFNDPNDPATIQRLNDLNKQLDDELSKIRPNNAYSQQVYNFPKFLQVPKETNKNIIKSIPLNYSPFPESKINGFDSKSLNSNPIDFINTKESPLCIRREGMLKIRDVDQKDKDVVVTYAVLTKERLSYFVNAKDESSIQGSIDLGRIKESIKLINGFPTCFTIKTIDGVSDCSVCAESEDSTREWINAITQNAVNCNTISVLSNMKKRGLLN